MHWYYWVAIIALAWLAFGFALRWYVDFTTEGPQPLPHGRKEFERNVNHPL